MSVVSGMNYGAIQGTVFNDCAITASGSAYANADGRPATLTDAQMRQLAKVITEQRASAPAPAPALHYGFRPGVCPEFQARDQVTKKIPEVTCPTCWAWLDEAERMFGPSRVAPPAPHPFNDRLPGGLCRWCGGQSFDHYHQFQHRITPERPAVLFERCGQHDAADEGRLARDQGWSVTYLAGPSGNPWQLAFMQAYRTPAAPLAPPVPAAPVTLVYCSAAPPRELVAATLVRRGDGPLAPTVPMVFTARMQRAWEHHAGWPTAEHLHGRYDREQTIVEHQDQFGGWALRRANGNPYRCERCGAQMYARAQPALGNGG